MKISVVKLVLLCALIAAYSAGTIIDTSESEKEGLVEAVVQILQSCYSNGTTAIGLAGSSAGMISKGLWARGSAPITLVDGIARNRSSVNLQHTLQVFAITASSPMTLTKSLVEIKASIWWNHMANFLVINVDYGCSNALKIMWAAWEMNVLKAHFLCHHRTKGRLIYTFNPYTSYAPSTWQIDKTLSGKNNHPWTLFVRMYEDDEGVCNELDYDKTADLGGYEIRVAVVDAAYSGDRTDSNRICVSLFDDIICKVIFHALNATPNVKTYRINSIGYLNDNGSFTGLLDELFRGLRDVGISERYLTSVGNLPYAYPHFRKALRSLSHYSGYKSQLRKILSVIDRSSRVGLCLVCSITLLFFKYFMRQSVTQAQLSMFRIICNSSLPTISRKLAPRIYLGSLFLFALTMQGIYQGKLASLLTMHERLRNVNTMNDLAELGHTIYGLKRYRRYFSDPEFRGGFVEVATHACAEYVIHNPRAACVREERFLAFEAVQYNLHMSSESLVPFWAAIPIRPDWPLERRLSMVLRTAIEAQGLRYTIDKAMDKTLRLLQIQENCDKDQTARVLNLEQLGFAFAMLGVGLGCAFISFIIEVILGRNRSEPPAKQRNRFRHIN